MQDRDIILEEALVNAERYCSLGYADVPLFDREYRYLIVRGYQLVIL